ncbi:helix-turn-helix domain-containing protein, partial [Deinococcus sp. HMF7604]|uniref:helix-turn-helix domain-containing protein n=1 Tax=Deinococcus betulae TaxID=2873312 RepID=UPI001CCED28F
VINDDSFHPHLLAEEYLPHDRVFLKGLSPEERLKILELEGVILEVLTGFRSGRADTPGQNEPRPNFNPDSTTLTKRYSSAAQELECGTRTIRRWCKQYYQNGLAGLRDRRTEGHRVSQWKGRALQDIIEKVSDQAGDSSTVTRRVLIGRIRRIYKADHPGAPFPSDRTLYRLTDMVSAKKGLTQQAKTRQGKARNTQGIHYTLIASRLGEYVMIDVSPWDILLRSIHHPDQPRRYRMLVALDLYHRGIVGFSLHAEEPKDVDAAFLLHDIVNPKYMMPGWPSQMRYPYVGAPESLVIDQHQLGPDVQLTAQGFVAPSSVTIDNGKIFTSRVFQDACRRLGITIIISRPYTPTDKGAVERFFGTVEREFASQFIGYVGQNTAHRGKDPPVEQLHWVDEFQDAFLNYYCSIYMRKPHDGLTHPIHPKKSLSPAEMFDIGLRTGGMIRVPLDADVYYQLLPSTTKKVTASGVSSFGLKYDHEGLSFLRGDKRKHEFSYDPRDLRYLYYRNENGVWLRLHRKPADFPHLPFTEAMLRAACSDADVNLRITGEEANERLDIIIRGMEDLTRKRKRSRPEATAASRLSRVEEDRHRTAAPLPIDSPVSAVPPLPSSIPASLTDVEFTTAADDADLTDYFS